MKMRLYLISLFIILYSCNSVSDVYEVKFYRLSYYTEKGENKLLKIEVKEFDFHNIKDSLIFKKEILIDKQYHELRKYSNSSYSPMDGERITYELDSIGIIFSSSLSWNSLMKFKTSSDSINNIINRAMDFALIYSELSNDANFKRTGEVVKFEK